MAVKARSVHLIFSKDQKLGNTTSSQSHQFHTIIAFPMTLQYHTGVVYLIIQNNISKTTSPCGSPPEDHKQSHKSHTASSKPQSAHNSFTTVPPHCSPHFLCGQSNTTSSQSHQFHSFIAFPLTLQYHTGVVYLINCHGLTFDLLPRPTKASGRVKGHTGQGQCPPVHTFMAPKSKTWARNAMPTRKQ